jgi:hypothetical protein
VSGGLPEEVPLPPLIAATTDFRAILDWAIGECTNRRWYGWLLWSDAIRMHITPDGVVHPESFPGLRQQAREPEGGNPSAA